MSVQTPKFKIWVPTSGPFIFLQLSWTNVWMNFRTKTRISCCSVTQVNGLGPQLKSSNVLARPRSTTLRGLRPQSKTDTNPEPFRLRASFCRPQTTLCRSSRPTCTHAACWGPSTTTVRERLANHSACASPDELPSSCGEPAEVHSDVPCSK